MIGDTLGPYRILGKLGAGGMGEVYRARDTKLGREAALKVLPDAFAQDRDRMVRFEREARLLASLTHPHIAAIYGLEESAGIRAIAMELVDGLSLADLLRQGPLPLAEALQLARQVADALDAAHEKGIIHRDLKPANVMVTPEGRVKVLDFGLAKALGYQGSEDPGLHQNASELANSPTISAIATRAGVILGTAAYMSPEQARGKPLDRRTDVWSFGCLLYEMLTGSMAFRGDTVSDVIAGILEHEPDWRALPEKTPTQVKRLLRRCLQKDARLRLRDMGDAGMEIDEALAGPSSGALEASPAATLVPPPAWWRGRGIWMAATGLMTAVAALAVLTDRLSSPAQPPQVRWVQVSAPELTLVKDRTIDISRDGGRLVYVGEKEGIRQLYLRPLDEREAKPIPNTEGALSPFFSPDGQWVAFWADQKLRKQPLSGGWTALYDAPLSLWGLPLAARWNADGWILFSGIRQRGVLQRIRESGGAPEGLISADPERNEWYLLQPELLPDGDHMLFTAALPGFRVVVQSLKTGQRQTLVEDAYAAHYAPTGHLLYMQRDQIIAVPFDPTRLVMTGTPVAVVDGVQGWSNATAAGYAASDNGTLAFVPAVPADPGRTFVWVDRRGHEEPACNVRGVFSGVRLSPDGKKVATWDRAGFRVVVVDLERGSVTPVNTEGPSAWNIWSRDGRRVVFNSVRPDSPGTPLFWQVQDGSAPAERLTTTGLLQQPRCFTSDGSVLVYQELHPDTGYDIWTLPMKSGAATRPLLRTPFNEYQPSLSPDGRWLAYVSNESGRDELWVRSFPAMDQRVKVSSEGGGEPSWSPDGRELLYTTSHNPSVGSRLMAVEVNTKEGFRPGASRTLVEGPYSIQPLYGQSYDISRDGSRFLMLKIDPLRSPTHISVVLNWFEELKRRAPVGTR